MNGHATPEVGRRPAVLGVKPLLIADLIIGPFCIVRGHALLTADLDFAPIVRHLGLTLILSDREAICI